jgi:hypothetical protein
LPAAVRLEIDELCEEFEDGWLAGERPRLKDYPGRIAADGRKFLVEELVKLEVYYRGRLGLSTSPEAILEDHAGLGPELEEGRR